MRLCFRFSASCSESVSFKNKTEMFILRRGHQMNFVIVIVIMVVVPVKTKPGTVTFFQLKIWYRF
jgi:hypothetical protein